MCSGLDASYRNCSDSDWPYPVRYGEVNEVEVDVLVIGGGIAGCYAAISAAEKGVKVAVMDKASIIRSGSGGTGVDHWHGVCNSPVSKITPEEMISTVMLDDYGNTGEFGLGISAYILFKESYDTLLYTEKMGLQIRDVDDEFSGAEFRDEETKLLFAYDYENKHCVRFMGGPAKPILYKELKRMGVELYEHVMSTSLLTENGKQGARVLGATGVNVRTGEFLVFTSKSTVLAAARPGSIWGFQTELKGMASIDPDPNCVGDGHAIAWRAGAEFALMERSEGVIGRKGAYNPSMGFNTSTVSKSGFFYPVFGFGSASTTWFACNIVDSNGKEIPWQDRDGKILKSVSERYRPSKGQKFQLYQHDSYPYRSPSLIHDLPERIRKGEYVLPLYADLSGMPEHERRAIWGLMVGNEGKTRIPIYDLYNKAGFDPDKDMLQVPLKVPDSGSDLVFALPGLPQWRLLRSGGPIFDWDLKTTLEGLYAAGEQLMGGGNYSMSATTGSYAGRKAAAYALKNNFIAIDRIQVNNEKDRVYTPLTERNSRVGWKELWAGTARIMQDYCGAEKSEEILNNGLKWLREIRESEAANAFARNPHELWRTLECMVRITVCEMIIHASLVRKASSDQLQFYLIDHPQVDPPEWNKFITTRLENNKVKVGEKPLDYWLKDPYESTYEKNYNKHCGL